MEKRVLLAIFLSFVVLYLFQTVLMKPAPKPVRPKAVPSASEQAGEAVAGGQAAAASAPATTPAAAPHAPAQPGVRPIVGDQAERETVVETQTVRAVFVNRGARLKSWRLKQYFDANARPLELVPSAVPPGTVLPFTLRTDDAAVNARLDAALFRPSVAGGATETAIDATKAPVTLVFEYQDAAGLVARKEFAFQPASYAVSVTATVREADRRLNPSIAWGPALGDAPAAGSSSRYTQKAEGVLYRSGSVERLSAKALEGAPVQEADFRFVGVDDQYFMSVALAGKVARVEYRPMSIPLAAPPGQQAPPPHELVAYSARFAGGAVGIRYFFGPKDFDVLKAVDPELVRVINFGVFSFLAVPLLGGLKWINAYVGNYGWSIIILTVLINVAIFPLRHKSVVSMRKLQELQPEIKAIQDRYGKLKTTDPARQKMNAEMMNLYRERGVNPASGCIPMLLTIPVLFAFYSLLSQAIEIRGAPFALWIKDLSMHDPLYVTPILMGITMVWQQKLTPTSVDPAQQKMMMFMPVMFTFFFLWAPSGLVLYWLVSNLLAIAQQYVTNQIVGPPAVRTVRPPAERRVKKAGSGKTA